MVQLAHSQPDQSVRDVPWRLPAMITAGSLGLCVAAALIPAEWSLVDDPGLKSILEGNIESAGLLPGIWNTAVDHAQSDRAWGLFRPVYYLYESLFYLANPHVAHGLRMAMFLMAVLVPAVLAARRGRGWDHVFLIFAVATLLANSHLYQGLSFLSLQELTGIALVAGGLLVPRPGLRGVLFLAAALTKAPFVWLALAWAAALILRKETQVRGVLLALAGVATLLLAYLAASQGTYTSAYSVSLARIEQSLRQIVSLLGWASLIGLLGFLLLRIDPRQINWRDRDALVFLAGGAGYLVSMLPWGFQAYYGSPVVWMLSVAGIRILATSPRRTVSLRSPVVVAVLTLCVVLGVRMAWIMGGDQYDRNATVVGLREWASTIPNAGVTVGINGPEASLTLNEIIRFDQSDWQNSMVHISDAGEAPDVDFYIALLDQGPGNPELTRNPILMLPRATVFRP